MLSSIRKGDRVYVITNHHVAGDADEITISLFDGRQYKAELAGSDPDRDLALISFVSDESLPKAVFGDSMTWRRATGSLPLVIPTDMSPPSPVELSAPRAAPI